MLNEPFRTIDLGVYLDQAAYPPWGFKAKYVDHAQGAKAMANFMNARDFAGDKKVEKGDFPESLGLAWTQVEMSDHAGNHIDAPWHFGAAVNGEKAKTIDEVPLEWCMGRGVRLDFRDFEGKDIQKKDVERALELAETALTPGMIPLLWTGADKHIDDDKKYWERQGGLSEEGLHYFLDHGVKLIGIDAYAMDVSHDTMQREFEKGEPRFFPLHFVGRQREHMHLEKLTNLDKLPRASGFWFMAFPTKLRGGSAGWVRPVALVPEAHFETANSKEQR